MNSYFQDIIKKTTGASEIVELQEIQSLWSGYGKITRYSLKDSLIPKVVIKHICLPKQDNHPRGWNTNLSHLRKLKSYQIEMAWYNQWSLFCDDHCRIPKCLAQATMGDEMILVLEDLNMAGFSKKKTTVSHENIKTCLSWLAYFHATFMGKQPNNLWETGTYWHLETRPDELEILSDQKLKQAAKAIDELLKRSPYQTFVHGDAKLSNFCFSPNGKTVAAVDFQYVGGGCGMKDVAYFIGSCLYEDECEQNEEWILNIYFQTLKKALKEKNNPIDPDALEQNWRYLFPVAWTDFHRFLKGWSPGHWKLSGYSERVAKQVLSQLKS